MEIDNMWFQQDILFKRFEDMVISCRSGVSLSRWSMPINRNWPMPLKCLTKETEIYLVYARMVCSCSNKIRGSLSVVSSLWVKHGYTTTVLKPKNTLNNGFPRGNLYQKWRILFGREGYGDCLLGFSRNNLYWVSRKGSSHYRSILFIVIRLFENRVARKMSTIGVQKNPFHLKQLPIPCLSSCGRKTLGIRVSNRSISLLFSRLGTVGLLFVLRYEEMAGGKRCYWN